MGNEPVHQFFEVTANLSRTEHQGLKILMGEPLQLFGQPVHQTLGHLRIQGQELTLVAALNRLGHTPLGTLS